MKTKNAIRGRIRSLLLEELECRLREACEREPTRCAHHHCQPLDTRKEVYGETNPEYNRVTTVDGDLVNSSIGICLLGSDDPENWRGTICEDTIDAKRCPYFTPRESKEEVWTQFHSDVHDAQWVYDNLPAVQSLLWVSGEHETPPLPWWVRLWYRWILRVEVSQPIPIRDPDLLPPGPDHPNPLLPPR